MYGYVRYDDREPHMFPLWVFSNYGGQYCPKENDSNQNQNLEKDTDLNEKNDETFKIDLDQTIFLFIMFQSILMH